MELIDKYMWYQEGPGVRKNQYTSSGVKLLNVANLVEGKIELSTSSRYISEDEANGRYNHFLVDEGDLIIASSGIQVSYFEKKMGIAEKKHLPLCMNTSTIRFKVLDKNITDIRYFMYFLKSNVFKKQIRKLITGSAQLNFGPSHLKKIKIEMPELKKQQEIVKKLDRVKKIIDIRNNQIIELNELIKSQFVEMFGNPIINDKKFEFKQIGEVTKIVTGTTPDTKDVENWNGGINWITPAEIKEDTLYIYETERKITEKGQKSKSLTLMPKGTVIFSTRAPIGKTAIAGIEMCCNQGFKNCICSININNIYLYYVFKNNTIYFNNLGTGATFKELSKRVFEKVKIAVPPITLQNQFSEIVKQIDKQKFEIEKSLKKIQELYESLMEKYFG